MSATQAAIDALFDSNTAATDAPKERSRPQIAKKSARKPDIDRILKLPITVNATLAECDMPIESLLALTAGSIIEFEKSFDAELSLRVGNREIGAGQAVKVGEHFGLRLNSVDTVKERIDALSGE